MADLDQGGTFRQTQSTFLGPSVGWITAPRTAIIAIIAVGTTTIQIGTTLVTVNVNGSVTIQLPLAKGNSAGAGTVPGTYIGSPITIVDIGGFALAHPIAIQPAGTEKIDGLSSINLASNFGSFVLQPDVINGGWILTQ